VKETLKKYAKRYDVIFSFGGTFISAAFVYAEKLPIWAILAVIFAREVCGFMAMLSKERDEESVAQGVAKEKRRARNK
jgi:hypothetical protein